jgi:hypothetical protein
MRAAGQARTDAVAAAGYVTVACGRPGPPETEDRRIASKAGIAVVGHAILVKPLGDIFRTGQSVMHAVTICCRYRLIHGIGKHFQ